MATYDWSKFGLHIPEMMLPKEGTDYFKWAVVACDQYTSEPEYWDKVEEIVGDSPSALRLMLPELYLDGPDEADRIKAVRAAMDKYLADGTLRKMEPGCMLIKRTAEGRTRMGLVIATFKAIIKNNTPFCDPAISMMTITLIVLTGIFFLERSSMIQTS